MKHVYLIINWGLGIFFLLIGLFSLIKAFLAGLCLIIISALLLPPVREFVYLKTNKELTVKVRVITIFILLITCGFFAGRAKDKMSQELAAQQAHEKSEQDTQIRKKNEKRLLKELEAIPEQDYEKNKSIYQQLLSLNPNNKLYKTKLEVCNEKIEKKKQKQIAAEKAKETESLLKELNSIPEQDYEKNKSIYQKLSTLNPKNEFYKTKIDFYSGKIEEEKQKQIAAEKIKETESLLKELNTIPEQDYEKNKNIYQKLLTLNPDNELYKTKVAFYSGKIDEEKQKQIAVEARKQKIESQFSRWDGSHCNLEKFIKDSMNDPDSYKHVETVYWDKGEYLIVRTTFRGKNAFGGVVKNSVEAKVSLDGQIIEILSNK